jgi:hypothetical protein
MLRTVARNRSSPEVLMPLTAAFVVSALSALAIERDLTGPGLKAMVTSLVSGMTSCDAASTGFGWF